MNGSAINSSSMQQESAWPHVDACLRDPRLWRLDRPKVEPRFWFRDSGLWLPLSCAIAFDASSEGAAAAPSLTFGITVGTGDARMLVVGAYVTDAHTLDATHAGQAMFSNVSALDDGNRRLYLFSLKNPTSGTNNVVVTADSGSPAIRGIAVSYTGVAQADAAEVAVKREDTVNTNDYSTNITPLTDKAWLVGVALTDQIMTGTGAAVKRYEHVDGNFAVFDTNGPVTPIASTAFGITMTFFSTHHILCVGSFAPASGGGIGYLKQNKLRPSIFRPGLAR